ncbi:MAG: aminotransferase [Chloroflexi bacterium]|nr:MAG: aminotransferase [Chloroflexota bacterium]
MRQIVLNQHHAAPVLTLPNLPRLPLHSRFVLPAPAPADKAQLPLLDGQRAPYINLDNAASTTPLPAVWEAVQRFLPYYSSVHRGSGFKSRLSTVAYEEAHEIIGKFVGADLETNTVIFGKNTTEAINLLAQRLPLQPHDVVLTTLLEHHSNDLPWRARAHVVHVRATPEGRLDEEDFDRKLAEYAGRVALVAVTGASNVTGFMPPIHRLAAKAHAVGAEILVDAAQLAPHRRIDMRADDDPEHLDYVALSAHKMYAPFGAGALIGPKQRFLQSPPAQRGGGTVEIVTLDQVYWSGLPDREEAGSPNVVGAVAMAVAAQQLMAIGMDQVASQEHELTAYALQQLQTVPGLTLYGERDGQRANERTGVIPFNLDGIPHGLVAAILGYEAGIGVRNGCFCAHPYVVHLLGLTEQEQTFWRWEALTGDKSHMPGMVRISLGHTNRRSDIDRLVSMLWRIVQGEYEGRYQVDPKSGDYTPRGYTDRFADYFSLSGENK